MSLETVLKGKLAQKIAAVWCGKLLLLLETL